ncbi:MAG: hypothetical protein CR975_07050 [Gammaproteobacteria bacterium]|nr:MAG: hypothetical protein CR975_07050 [Gammaproteobacteria bacterium]
MEQEMVILLIVMGLVALLIGFLIGQIVGSSGSSTAKAEKELQEYKAAVSEHFGKTADLVDNLTNSYRQVFEHLGSSARQLLSEEEVNKHLKSRAQKAVTLSYLADTEKPKVKKETAQAADSKEVADKVKTEPEKTEKTKPEKTEKIAEHPVKSATEANKKADT